MEDEKKLLIRCKSGDIGSFEILIKSYQKMAYNISYRIMGNEEDAKDMSQESFIKIYKKIKSFRMDSSFSTWLYRIVMNTCKDELRKRKMKVISIDRDIQTKDGSMKFEIEDTSNTPEQELELKETQKEIQNALLKVNEVNRIVLVLRDIKGFSYSEISEIIEAPIGTIKSRINRGRGELKKILIDKKNKMLAGNI